jgi:SAM-dependent methyltransferase
VTGVSAPEPRTLATTFSEDVDAYDRLRPDYPATVLDLCAPGEEQRTMLEIGCGSGKATRLFVARATRLVAVDLSSEMVKLARRNVPSERIQWVTGAFETVALPPGPYDLIFCAQAFHWLDVDKALARVIELLAPGGRLALFWNFLDLDHPGVLSAMRDAIVERVPAFSSWPDSSELAFSAFTERWLSTLEARFGRASRSVLVRDVRCDRAHLLECVRTFSWWKMLEPSAQAALATLLEPLIPPSFEARIRTFVAHSDDAR